MGIQQAEQPVGTVPYQQVQAASWSVTAVFRIASKFVIHSLTAPSPEWGRIILAVVLSGATQVVTNQIYYFLFLLPAGQGNLLLGAQFAGTIILQTVFQMGSVFAPLIFGFWASLGWPGKHLPSYTVLGLSAGAITMIGQLGSDLLLGSLGLPQKPSGVDAIYYLWEFYVVVLLIGPAAVFASGALIGDLAKWEKPSSRGETESGLTYKLLDYFSNAESGPNKLLVRAAQIA